MTQGDAAIRISSLEARKTSLDNKQARIRGRGAANRLEPECFPVLKPKFKFEPGAKIFTIGSCSARNIERGLSDLGFDIPTVNNEGSSLESINNNIMNKYTPPAIWQEFSWAHRIAMRDGIVGEDDVRPLFLDLGGGKFVDLHLFPLSALDHDLALQRRQAVFRVFE